MAIEAVSMGAEEELKKRSSGSSWIKLEPLGLASLHVKVDMISFFIPKTVDYSTVCMQ
jgi:hypothetical protein